MMNMKTFTRHTIKPESWSYALSVLLHLSLVGFIFLMPGERGGYPVSGGNYSYYDVDGAFGTPALQQSDVTVPAASRENEALPSDDRKRGLHEINSDKISGPGTGTAAGGAYRSIESAGFDSLSLVQYYHEPTLNVRMKYPGGWVFIDQQRRKKLDGITFWAAGSTLNPPPYIHVEVTDKYLFNPELYKHKYDFGKFTGFYNDPVELESQVSQIIYIRTNDEEDYTIKLIMNGRAAFNGFQPVFFAVVRSFDFGGSFF